MGSKQRQLAALGGLLAILAVVIWWQSRGGDAAPLPAAAIAAAATPARPVSGPPVPSVGLAELSREAREPVDSGRDPFRFGEGRPRRAGEATGSSGDLNPSAPAGSAGGPSAAARERAEPAAPPLPPIAFKFVGILQSKQTGLKVAVLTDSRGLYYGSEGTVIEGRYRIVRITPESVEMTYLDGRGRRMIPLTGA